MMGVRGWTALVLPLALMSVVYAALIHDNGKVILPMDSFIEQDKVLFRVNATDWPGNHESYAGYVRVDAAKDINLFFWFCLAKPEKRSSAPVLLWLNGGPGVTSTVGALLENGPYQLNEDSAVTEREYAWTNEFHMLYVDNPVGTGYSYSSQGIVHDRMEDVVENLYQLVKFMNDRVFPEHFSKGLYLGGQSYAGKYAPHLGTLIHNNRGQHNIRLQGIYLGNALCDFLTMFPVYPDSLYHAGLISMKTRETYHADLNAMITETQDNGGKLKPESMSTLFGVPRSTKQDINFLLAPEQSMAISAGILEAFMDQQSTRTILNAGAAVDGSGYVKHNTAVGFNLLAADFVHGTQSQNKLLMENYKVLQYSGSMCMLVPTAMTDAFLDTVDWNGRDTYRDCSYTPWWIGENLAGWFATVANFTRVIVRNSGHNVPTDKPQAALEMMKNFIDGRPFA